MTGRDTRRGTLFFLPIKKMDQTNKFLTRKKGTLLKKKCDIFRGLCAITGIAGLVPLCYCAFMVISSALNFPCGYFGSEVFSCGYFVAWISRL